MRVELSKMIPPQAIESEQVLLGMLLLGKWDGKDFSSDFFYRDAHKIIFQSAKELQEKSVQIELVSMAQYLIDNELNDVIGGPAYLASLIDIISGITDINYHIKVVREKAMLRKIISLASEVAETAYEPSAKCKNILARLQRKTNDIISMTDVSNTSTTGMNFDSLMSNFIVRETHLGCLDKVIAGLPNDVVVIGGRTSMGKTSLALGFLRKIAIEDKSRVAYFGAGVTIKEVYFRLLSAMCLLDTNLIKRGSINSAQRQRLAEAHKIIDDMPKSIFTMSEKMSAMDINITTRALAEKSSEKLGAIIIENLQQLTWPEKFQSRKDELDVIFECFKSLALDLNIPIIISSQVKREVDEREDKRPHPSDLSGSGDIENLARLILLLYWDGYYVKEDVDGWIPAEIAIYKDGVPSVVYPEFNPATLSWRDK